MVLGVFEGWGRWLKGGDGGLMEEADGGGGGGGRVGGRKGGILQGYMTSRTNQEDVGKMKSRGEGERGEHVRIY